MRRTSATGPERERRFAEVYSSAYTDLVRFVSRRGRPEEAEDVVAEVFAVAWRRFDDLPSELDEARAWLFGIAYRTLLASNRAQGRRRALSLRLVDDASTGLHIGVDAAASDDRLDLLAAWKRLDPVHAEALALCAWDGLTSVQAGRVLDISPVAFRIRLSRARRALRLHLAMAPPGARAGGPSRISRPVPEGRIR